MNKINEHPAVVAAMERDPGRRPCPDEIGALRAIRDGTPMPDDVIDADIAWLSFYGFIVMMHNPIMVQERFFKLTRRGEEALARDEQGTVGT